MARALGQTNREGGSEPASLIANARMYSVSAEAGAVWRELLSGIIAQAGVPTTVIDYPPPAPLEDLWLRTDQAAVFMCGLPYSRVEPRPVLIAAPVPSPAEFHGAPHYWSDFVVRKDSALHTVQDAFGKRIAFTVPGSQSGCAAALSYLMAAHRELAADAEALTPLRAPLFSEIIAPTITPMGALAAVVDGAAHIAPIDSYALRLLRRYRPDLASAVRVVGQTVPTPIPPLVASAMAATDKERAALQSAFLEAHQSASLKPLMDELLLLGFVRPDSNSYTVLRERFDTATAYWGSHRLAAHTHPAFVL
jgi:ABC-type phosphate/phosphonate transport system substrate-binding protein